MKFISQKIRFATLLWLLTALIGCRQAAKEAQSAGQLPGSETILAELQQSADLVTTELTIRKIAIYDTSKSERFSWSKPSTWKYGDQKCIIPVEVTVKYGYDLRELSVRNIHVANDSSLVIIRLPKPKIIDAGYNTYIDEGSVVKMSTGLRSEVGHALEEEIRKKGYESVLKEDLTPVVGEEVRRNAQALLTAMVKGMGWKTVVIK